MIRFALSLVAVCFATAAQAQNFPSRPVTIVSPYQAGGTSDIIARVLAQKLKLNPDRWSDVRKTLPLLAQPEYYADAKYGYARGGMPVAFVDRVRAYYDILLRAEAPRQPRLTLSENEPVTPK